MSKHAIKQVDRLLSNPGFDVKELFMNWLPYVVGSRKNVEIAMDWTDFDADNQTTIMLLVWLAEALAADVKVLIVADRGFGDHKLYRVLTD